MHTYSLPMAVVLAALAGCTDGGGSKDLSVNYDDTGVTGDTDTDTDTDSDTDSDTDTDTDTDSDTDTDTDTDTNGGTVTHCGVISADETWSAADGVHFVDCDVDVRNAVLTITEGATVLFDRGSSIDVATDDQAGSLRVLGTEASPVLMLPAVNESKGEEEDPDGYWTGLTASSFADEFTLRHVWIEDAGAGTSPSVSVERLAVSIEDVSIVDSGNNALVLEGGASFDGSSGAIVIRGAEGYPVEIDADMVVTLPTDGSSFTGNGTDAVLVGGEYITGRVTWADLDIPYVINVTAKLEGTAVDPAVLTLDPGVELRFSRGKGLLLSKEGGASGLVAVGTASDPVVFSSTGAATPGYWDGIHSFFGTLDDAFHLSNVRIEYAGDNYRSALYLDSTVPLLEDVTILGSSEAGIRVVNSGRLADGSHDVTITGCDTPVWATAPAVGSFQEATSGLTGNTSDFFYIGPDNDNIETSVTWGPLDVPYWVDDDIYVDGTESSPAILTIEPGTTAYFDNETALFVSKDGGPAGLVAEGTSARPIVFTAGASATAGAWDGVGFYSACIDASSRLDYVEIAYGGGTQLRGDVHLYACDASIDHAYLHHSEEYGLYTDGGASPTLGASITYANNTLGDTN